MEEIVERYPAIYLSRLRAIKQVHVEAMRPLPNPDVKCYWLWGKTGTGKSRLAFSFNEVYCKNPNKWWDNYQGQDTVLIDDWSREHHVLGYYLKRWADRYPILSEIKGSALYPHYNRIIITSNYVISDCFNDSETVEAIERRFIVYKVTGHTVDESGDVIVQTDKGPLSKNLM